MSAPGPANAQPPAFDSRQFRDALAQFATGVTVICAPAGERRYVGFTANSFNSVSLAPPLILWSLAREADCLAAFEATERYTVNVLAAEQVELAHRFSRPHADRFAGVDYRLGWADAPLIEGCVAWFECRHHSRQQRGRPRDLRRRGRDVRARDGARARVPPRALRHDDAAAIGVRPVIRPQRIGWAGRPAVLRV